MYVAKLQGGIQDGSLYPLAAASAASLPRELEIPSLPGAADHAEPPVVIRHVYELVTIFGYPLCSKGEGGTKLAHYAYARAVARID